ncbi:modifier of snc1 [Forsythia ovata]|uniref:Modifier of snc1 n=1 Tax=Forsythia ovata TaxID=205694 RepID=A0ABD1P6M1_9LAMI
MTSSMLGGERRWASARRGGMSVGKVAAPKPLNLPSQRLENHGLDRNVEIVPKGTLSWGSRSSSSVSNPWGSSTMSPNADGGTSSSSHLSGRPSSGGSDTRPSTAGSDITHEPTDRTWSSNSRPSSASGVLSSNQMSLTSLRPRSAETRPNSSLLSRFAEPVSESSGAWGPSSTAERLGVKCSKEDGFSLSSGDFPTLGTDRDNDLGHGCPNSASGKIAQTKEKTTTSQADNASLSLDVNSGTVKTWKRDGSGSAENDIHPNVEKWQGEPQQYFNANFPSQHFDAWRGPPINAPAGVWYRGPPGGAPFGGHVAPGGFPMEPFPYYRPQIPPPGLAGSQPVPPLGTNLRGPHPKNGDIYRPQMPDAFAHPSMPCGPGFYPGPMAYEGYYGPSMGYCNTNEREVPYTGTAAGPPVYNRYSVPSAPDHSNSHGRAGGHGSSSEILSEQVEAAHLDANRGSHKVLLKNHDEWDGKGEGENWECNVSSNASLRPGKGGQPVVSSRKNEWGAADDTKEDVYPKRTPPGENSSPSFNHQGHSSGIVKVKPLEGTGNVKVVNDWCNKKSEISLSFPPEIPKQSLGTERDSSLPPTTKDSVLMQKIEGLNAKVRASDGRLNVPYSSSRVEQRNRSQVVDAENSNSSVEVSNTGGFFERTPASGDLVPASHKVSVPAGAKMSQPTTVSPRRPYHVGQGRIDHRGKEKFNGQDADGWQKKPATAESSSVIVASNVDPTSDIHASGHNFVVEAAPIPVINLSGEEEGESLTELNDSAESQAHHAKMRGLAKQRALQRQMEEEERTREQKAKAFAKLEDLNRRTQAGEAETLKADKTQAVGTVQREQEESIALAGPLMVFSKFQSSSPSISTGADFVAEVRDSSASQTKKSANMPRDLPRKSPQTGQLELIDSHGQSWSMKHDALNPRATLAVSQSNDGCIFRHKWMDNKQKQSVSHKNWNENQVLNDACEAPKSLTDASLNDIKATGVNSSEVRPSSESNSPNIGNINSEPSTQQRRRSNKSSKDKHKLDKASPIPALPSIMPKDNNSAKESTEIDKSKTSLPDIGATSDGGVQAPEVHSSLPNEEADSRVSNQWKPHHHRRMTRNQQSNRFLDNFHSNDAVMWAPVRSQNKDEGAVETSEISIPESSTVMWAPVRSQNKDEGAVETSETSIPESSTAAKTDNIAQNSFKSKRAEMERYVPKPVAKEPAQQGSIQPVTSSVRPSASDEASGRASPVSAGSGSMRPVSSATGIVGPGLEFKEGDGRHNKQGKTHGMWRQRSSTDSSHAKRVHNGSSLISDPSKEVQKIMGQNQSVNPEINSVKAEAKALSEISASESWNMSGGTGMAAVGKAPAVKDQGVTASDVNQTDRTIASKENRSSGERALSHWKPKSQSYSANAQHGKRASLHRVPDRAARDENSDLNEPQPVSESNMVEPPNVGHSHESTRESKHVPSRGRPYIPNQVSVGAGEPTPAANAGVQHERKFSSGFRRNGKQNHPSSRVHESHANWASGQDNRQHNIPADRGRQRQFAHYEYQQPSREWVVSLIRQDFRNRVRVMAHRPSWNVACL